MKLTDLRFVHRSEPSPGAVYVDHRVWQVLQYCRDGEWMDVPVEGATGEQTPLEAARKIIDANEDPNAVKPTEVWLPAVWPDTPALIDRLELLRAKTNEILQGIKQRSIDGMINWTDLKCVSAECVLDNYGDVIFRVLVTEAAPGNVELAGRIIADLDASGHLVTEVLFEW